MNYRERAERGDLSKYGVRANDLVRPFALPVDDHWSLVEDIERALREAAAEALENKAKCSGQFTARALRYEAQRIREGGDGE